MSDYKQVSCTFYDQLTDLISLKKFVQIDFVNEYKEFHTTQGILLDVNSEDKKEFLVLNTGVTIRLDRLRKVDKIVPPHVADNYYQCDC